MIAAGLTVALFVFWLFVGWAPVAVLHTRRNLLQSLLLAPSVGLVLTLLPVFWLSRAGLPVAWFSASLTVGLLAMSIGLLWWRRPLSSRRRYRPLLRASLPFATVLVLAFALTGRPMLEFGLDWVSYANDDMANYVVGGHHFAAHGYFEPPDAQALTEGIDYSLAYWDFVIIGSRLGSELLLSWALSVTGLTGHQVFMPVIMAMQLALISAAGALVCQSRRYRLAALMTCVLLTLSALSSLGVLYQLISQTGGLALLVSSVTLLLRTSVQTRLSLAIRHGILIGIVGAGLLVLYPEAAPFLALGFGLYASISLVRGRWALVSRQSLVALGTAAGSGLTLLNQHAMTATWFLLVQAGTGVTTFNAERGSLFPYYLVPTGLANLWGILPITRAPAEPWLSLSIGTGLCLMLLAIVAAFSSSWRLQPSAIVTVVMLTLTVQLSRQRADFGLFKLAMFAQPFLLGTITVAWFALVRRPVLRVVPLLFVGLLSFPGQLAYVEASRGFGSGLNELSDPSSTRINTEFRQLVARVDEQSEPRLVLDTWNVTLAKFQAVYTRGIRTQFNSRYFFWLDWIPETAPFLSDEMITKAHAIEDRLQETRIEARFPWLSEHDFQRVVNMNGRADPRDPRAFWISTIGQDVNAADPCTQLISLTDRQSIFNRWRSTNSPANFVLQDCKDVSNHLIFIESMLGRPYYANSNTNLISFYQLEPDIALQRGTFAGIGRWMLLQVLVPTDGARLMIHMTSTLKHDGDNALPPAEVIGVDHASMPFTGRGSARVFSPPITPLTIANRTFLGVDLGIDGTPFADPRTGLMALYGLNVSLDRRALVGFARDISLISQDDYDHLTPPPSISSFPADLANQQLEYSGIYEDGWISEAVFLGLLQPGANSTVVARGEVPQIDNPDFTTELRLLVDGQEVARRGLRTGRFEVRAPVPLGGGRRRVELRFSDIQRLGGEDGRPVAARMRAIGFDDESQEVPPEAIKEFPADVEGSRTWTSGLEPDGWITERPSIELSQPAESADLVLRGQVPQVNDPNFTTELRATVDGQEVIRRTLGVGDFTLRATLSTGAGRRRVELHFSAAQRLPPPDARSVAARVTFIGFEASAPASSGRQGATPVTASAVAAPQVVDDLPADLANPNLNAVGLDSDGWAAQISSFDLAQPGAPSDVVVQGMVPLIENPDYSPELQVLIDGQEIGRQTLGLGDFELRAPAPSGQGRRHIELRFSADQQLPTPDNRRVGARVRLVGFEAAASASPQPR